MSASVSGFSQPAAPHAQPARPSLALRVTSLALLWLSVTFIASIMMPPPFAFAFSSITLIAGLALIFSSDDPSPASGSARVMTPPTRERVVLFATPDQSTSSSSVIVVTSPPRETRGIGVTFSTPPARRTLAPTPASEGQRVPAATRAATPGSAFTTPGAPTPPSAAAAAQRRPRVLATEEATQGQPAHAVNPAAEGPRVPSGIRR